MLCHLNGLVRHFSARLFSYSTLSAAPEKWNLVTSVCVQRKPVIVKEMREIEKNVFNLLSTVEEESSLKSDWEIQLEEDLADIQNIKAGRTDKVGKKLRRDFEDEWKQEWGNNKLASRTTKEDESNNRKSTNRCLDSSLYLVVKQPQNGDRWIFPQGRHVQGETLRQTAERVLHELCGQDMKVCIYGNAPCGFFKYKYPKNIRDSWEVQGEKVFFFKGFLLGGHMKQGSGVTDYLWVDKNDFNSKVSHDFRQSVGLFLF